MLQKIRDNVQGAAAKVIVAIIVVPFAIFGIESLVGGDGDPVVAEVNGAEIKESELRRAVAMQQRQTMAMLGAEADPAMLDESRMRGPALERLVTQDLMLQAADRLGLGISGEIVDRELLAMPQFQQDGNFSQERYLAALRDQGYSPTYFKELVRSELLINQLLEGLSLSEPIIDRELRDVAALLQQKRTFGYVRIPVAPLAEKIEPRAGEIATYYRAHADEFMQPERVKLDYVELRAEQFSEPVDEAEIRAEYEREVAAFQAGTQRHAAHILVEMNDDRDAAQALARAQELHEQLKGGAEFDELARQHSDDLGSREAGGDLGFSSGDAFPAAFEAALAQLDEGEVSAPVRTEAGYHLIQLISAEEVTAPSFDERRADIEERLQQAAAQPALLQAVEKMRDLAFNSESLQEPAEQLSLEVKRSDWLSRDNSDALLSQPKLVTAAFSDEVLKEGNNSDAIELAADHFVVLRVADHQPSTQRPLEQVRSQVVAALQRDKAIDEATAQAQTLLAAWRRGDEPTTAVPEGLDYQQVTAVSRQSGDVDRALLQVAFELAPPGQGETGYRTTTLGNGDVVALRLEAVIDGSLDEMTEAERQALTSQLRQIGGRASFSAYLASLRGGAEIEFK